MSISNKVNDTIINPPKVLIDAIDGSLQLIIKNMETIGGNKTPIALIDIRKGWTAIGAVNDPKVQPVIDPMDHPYKNNKAIYFVVLANEVSYEGYIYLITTIAATNYHLSLLGVITGNGFKQRVAEFATHQRKK